MIMKTEINIAEILKDKPNGTKLYADAFGELKLERVKVNKHYCPDCCKFNNILSLYV